MTPPLPPGVDGEAVDPHIHTAVPDTDRDGWAGDIASDIAVRGLRRLRGKWAALRDDAGDWHSDSGHHRADAFATCVADVGWLLDKIGATR